MTGLRQVKADCFQPTRPKFPILSQKAAEMIYSPCETQP
jgi:hypothetical protein